MRKTLLASLMLLSLGAKAQSLSNTDFEDWTISTYDDPASYWLTGNADDAPDVTVSKVAGYQSTNAIRLQTIDNGIDTIPAFIINGEGDPISGDGGMPFAGQPTAINGYYRSSIGAGDTALLLVVLKANGNILSQDIFKFTGSHSSFTAFNFPINISSAADSVIIAATSSNAVDWVGVQPGSWIEFDSLEFTGATTQPVITNGNFEDWMQVEMHEPDDWQYDGDVKRSTDKYSGTYAAQLNTTDDGSGPNQAQLIGGMVYSGTIDTLSGWYKYATPGTADSGMVMIMYADGSGMPVHMEFNSLPPAANYTNFSFPLDDQGNGASFVALIFSSSSFFGMPEDGSTFLLDKLEVKQQNVGIKNATAKLSGIKAYPNPATDVLHVSLTNPGKDEVTVSVFDLKGAVQYHTTVKATAAGDIAVPVSTLSKGMYFYSVKTSAGIYADKFFKN